MVTNYDYVPVGQGCGSCLNNFGAECFKCDQLNGCTEGYGGFISGKYSFACSVIPDESRETRCYQESDQGIVPETTMSEQPRGTEVTVKYYDYEFSVTCDKLTEKCAECETDSGGQTQCSACATGYTLISGYCQSCDSTAIFTFADHCLECNNFACTKCEEGYYVNSIGWCDNIYGVYNNATKTYMDCSEMIAHCSVCESADRCSECQYGFGLDEDGRCKSCNLIFDGGCSSCVDSSECLECLGDSCCDENEFFSSWDQPCFTCADLYGENCAECTRGSCTACKPGYLLDVTSDDSCKDTCNSLFEGCASCNAWECTSCSDPDWVLTPNGCYKAPEHSSSKTSSVSEVSSSSNVPSSSSSKPVVGPSDDDEEDGGLGVGAIVGIVIACAAAVTIAIIAFCCLATAGKKHGKVDKDVYEEENEFVSMSVL